MIEEDRNISIVQGEDGKRIVLIHDILFYGRRNIKWDDVEEYLKRYVGKHFEILDDSEKIYIGSDLPSEYKGSNDTRRLKGPNAKAKANSVQGIPELIEIASNKRYKDNKKDKHSMDAKYGWYRYDTRIGIPVSEGSKIVRYNIYRVELMVRHSANKKKYLYDLVNIKKEAEYPALTEVVR